MNHRHEQYQPQDGLNLMRAGDCTIELSLTISEETNKL